MKAARRVLDIEHRALEGIFHAFAVTESSNNTGALTTSGMSFNEFAYMARECDLIPRYLSLSQLLIVFRQHRKIHAGDFDLDYSGVGAPGARAHGAHRFCKRVCTVAPACATRDTSWVEDRNRTDYRTAEVSFEGPRAKVLALVKTIANSRGIRQMALRPRRAVSVRFVSRMNGFK